MADELTNPEAHRRDEAELRKACHVDVGAPAGWPFEIEIGMPAARITSRARELGAQLIVMGLNRHSAISRVIGGHTVREVITTTDAPVLAVRPQLTTLPKSVVVAMDFGQASIRAAHLARRILDAHGTMHLVFVDVPVKPHASETEEAKEAIHARGVEAEFRELVEALDPGPGMTIASVECMGDPIAELQAACEQIEPDVVAMGRQRHSIFERLMVGSVTKAMVNDGRWSVLVMPPSATIATPPAANRPHLQY
jgi:nucleotide-binding universal stress UspA family protein